MNHPVQTGQEPKISFEFFPPKTAMAGMALWESVQRLAPLGPDFVSVTYGAGGTTRDRTLAAILAIRDRARLDVAGHLTCVGAPKAQVLKVARSYRKLGCRRIVALRGDTPGGAGTFEAHPEGYASSVDLVAGLAELGGFDIWVGAYPEAHPEASSQTADIDYLKRKFDAGAAGAITQFFFENEHFYRFRDACAKAGIDKPIVPGILPVTDFQKVFGFAARCGASVPAWLAKAAENAAGTGTEELLALAIASEQCDDLMQNGADRLHIYTLNKPELPYRLCTALGVRPQPLAIAASCG